MVLTRRQLLKMGVAGGAALLLPTANRASAQMGPGGGGGGMGGGGTGGGGMTPASPPTTPFQVALPVPTPLTPRVMTDPMTGMVHDYYDLSIKVAQKQFIPGLWTTVWGYNGLFSGVAIKARSGRPAYVKFTNQLPENAVVHLHGGHLPVEEDGHAMDYILPGASREYRWSNNQIASTLWFHDHAMDVTGPHIYRGMAGLYVLEDDFEASLPLPKGEQDVPLVIQDRAFNADGSFNYTLTQHSLMQGMQGDVILVNGAVQPYMKVQTRKYRFRILNGSNGRFYQLALSNGQSMAQIGSDGGLLPAPVNRASLYLGPGERIEVVLDFSRLKVGTQLVLKNQLGSGRTADVMRFDVAYRATDSATIPATLRPIQYLPAGEAVQTRTFTLGMSMDGKFTINGLPYDHMRVDAAPRLNTTEIWEFVNPMGMAHPMHAHDIMWQILDRNGAAPPAWEKGWKDTWVVPAHGRVQVIGKFTDYVCDPDPMAHMSNYMVHCHIAEHEDHGMMAQFKVLGAGTDPMPM